MPNPRIMEGYTPGVDDDPASYLEDIHNRVVTSLQAIPDDTDHDDDGDDDDNDNHNNVVMEDEDEPAYFPIMHAATMPTADVEHAPGASPSAALQVGTQQQEEEAEFPPSHIQIRRDAADNLEMVAPSSRQRSSPRHHHHRRHHHHHHHDIRKSWLLWIAIGLGVLLIILLAVAVIVLVRTFRDDNESNNNQRSVYQAFLTRDELLEAVDGWLLLDDTTDLVQRYGPIREWQVGQINNFAQLFDAQGRQPAAAQFNGDLSAWDVSQGTNFYAMFQGASVFNADISAWQTSRATDMSYAFAGATSFDQPIGDWDMRQVTNLQSILQGATSFNQDISAWQLSALTIMSSALAGATSFNQDLCAWNDHWRNGPVAAMDAFVETACPVANVPIDWNARPPSPLCFACPAQYECFATREQLLLAVDEYWIDASLVADRFGPVLGDWCVDGIADFAYVLSAARNPALSTFNQDVSQWKVSQAVSLAHMFQDSVAFNQSLDAWDVSSVQTLDFMLAGATSFNQDLSTWNVSSVTSALSFLEGATSFHQDLCTWRDNMNMGRLSGTNIFGETACPVSKVTTEVMCDWCVPAGAACFQDNAELSDAVDDYLAEPSGILTRSKYGHPIGSWCVQAVTDFDNLFSDERNRLVADFNQDLNGWDVSNAVSFFKIFWGARTFNQDLNSWNVGNVLEFGGAFNNCTGFNGDISSWDVSNARATNFMFNEATNFNQPLGDWNVSRVEYFDAMFQGASVFNQNLSRWNVGQGIDFSNMFYGALSFDSDLSRWDVSQATDMYAMLAQALPFNGDISGWDVGRVTNMAGILALLPLFNVDLSQWNVINTADMSLMFVGSSSFQQNLCAWGSRLPSNVMFDRTFSETKCTSQQDPDMTADPPGPFCEPCDG